MPPEPSRACCSRTRASPRGRTRTRAVSSRRSRRGLDVDRYRSDSRCTPRPVALGVVGSVAGLSDLEVAMVALYDDAATVACAALKLLGLDPAQTARWLADLAPRIGAMAAEVADETRPVAQQPPPATVAIELAAARHANRRERFFVS